MNCKSLLVMMVSEKNFPICLECMKDLFFKPSVMQKTEKSLALSSNEANLKEKNVKGKFKEPFHC